MNNATRTIFRTNRAIPALVAATGGLVSMPAAAIELGELTVHSKLGQPLRASIAYALAPNEQINNYCIAMRPGASLSGLPNVAPATLSVANGVIMLVGETAVREPMVSAHIVVNCPYSAHISREYMLFVDPATTAYEAPAVTQQVNDSAVAVTPAPVRVAQKPRPAVSKDLTSATRYQVQPGDSLSQIAQRIENRPVGLWPAVNAIFEANPSAFLDNDPNKLKAGSWLTIPSFDGSKPQLAANDARPASTAPQFEASVPVAQPAAETDSVPVESTAETFGDIAPAIATLDSTADLKPGDVVLDTTPLTNAAVGVETDVIPDTQLDGPVSTASSPNVATATVAAKEAPAATSTGWLLLFAGGGIAIILALLAFGRRMRDRVNAEPDELMLDTPRRRMTDVDTEQVEAVAVDFDLSDDSPTEENLALDADLVIGTGLADGDEMEVAQDFGFATTNVVDVELPFEPNAADIDTDNPLQADETDMLPAMRTDEHSILDSEILPDDAEDYDMSVIVDATKMPQPDDVTERDLKAIPVSTSDDTQVTDNYTISKEIDYEILEQDYEDELTATQALNLEIARAAAELAEQIDNDNDETTAMPLATVTELDVTAHLPARNDDSADPDATGINEAPTVNMSAADKNAAMPVADHDDDTAEMPIKSGKKG